MAQYPGVGGEFSGEVNWRYLTPPHAKYANEASEQDREVGFVCQSWVGVAWKVLVKRDLSDVDRKGWVCFGGGGIRPIFETVKMCGNGGSKSAVCVIILHLRAKMLRF
ncbi:hypothetical protein AVEN_270305-1 [Araneus ventricosus]|uniref:Uncharacterized protein n=1 Tax=Araneus ventricosus TaxID=182803 RepID=A0A4Y2RNV4_ARAVE|nr:hypothetical protein AVEN_270305-1 [Araneus ventricosus]